MSVYAERTRTTRTLFLRVSFQGRFGPPMLISKFLYHALELIPDKIPRKWSVCPPLVFVGHPLIVLNAAGPPIRAHIGEECAYGIVSPPDRKAEFEYPPMEFEVPKVILFPIALVTVDKRHYACTVAKLTLLSFST